jgi:hypothetical protein
MPLFTIKSQRLVMEMFLYRQGDLQIISSVIDFEVFVEAQIILERFWCTLINIVIWHSNVADFQGFPVFSE